MDPIELQASNMSLSFVSWNWILLGWLIFRVMLVSWRVMWLMNNTFIAHSVSTYFLTYGTTFLQPSQLFGWSWSIFSMSQYVTVFRGKLAVSFREGRAAKIPGGRDFPCQGYWEIPRVDHSHPRRDAIATGRRAGGRSQESTWFVCSFLSCIA